MIDRSWDKIAVQVETYSEVFYRDCAYGISTWLKMKANRLLFTDKLFPSMIEKVIKNSPIEQRYGDDYVSQAINMPVGKCVEAIFEWWFTVKPKDNDLLPNFVKKVFTDICEGSKETYICGKVILSSNIISLFRVDKEWTNTTLIPLFDWNQTNRENAISLWQGYLWNPRIYYPFLLSIKKSFLETANHRDLLGIGGKTYIRLITHLGVDKPEGFVYSEISSIINSFDLASLDIVAEAVKQIFSSFDKTREEIWDNRISKFLHQCWPKDKNKKSSEITTTFTLMCIDSGLLFKKVYTTLEPFISIIEYPGLVLLRLCKSDVCANFPELVLDLLVHIIDEKSERDLHQLHECLELIGKHKPHIEGSGC